MAIWRYRIAHNQPGDHYAYGVPVEVFFAGRRFRAVYQFGIGGDTVVHFESGRILAHIAQEDLIGRGPPDRAQAALNRRRQALPHDDATIWGRLERRERINNLPTVVGAMRRPGHD